MGEAFTRGYTPSFSTTGSHGRRHRRRSFVFFRGYVVRGCVMWIKVKETATTRDSERAEEENGSSAISLLFMTTSLPEEGEEAKEGGSSYE